jgi:hypothetical protein
VVHINQPISEGSFLGPFLRITGTLKVSFNAFFNGNIGVYWNVNITLTNDLFQVETRAQKARGEIKHLFILGIKPDQPKIGIMDSTTLGHCINGGFKKGRLFCCFQFNRFWFTDIAHHANKFQPPPISIALTAKLMGKVAPSLRRAVTSRGPTPMIFPLPVRRKFAM